MRNPANLTQLIPPIHQKHSQFLRRSQALEIIVKFHLLGGGLARPGHIKCIGINAEAVAGTVEVETVLPGRVGMFQTFPPAERMLFAAHQLDRVAEPAPHRGIHHRQGNAIAAVGFMGVFIFQKPVDKALLGGFERGEFFDQRVKTFKEMNPHVPL